MPGSSRRGVLRFLVVLLCSSWRWRASRRASCSGRLVGRLVPRGFCLGVSLYRLVVPWASRLLVSWWLVLRRRVLFACYAVLSGCGPHCRLSYRYRYRRHHRIGRCCVCSGAAGCSARLVGRVVHRGGGRGCGFAAAALGSSLVSFLCLLLFMCPSLSHRAVGRGRGCGSCLRSGRCSSVSTWCD